MARVSPSSTGKHWRRPRTSDHALTLRSRFRHERGTRTVAWNREYQCWALADALHILVAVDEVYGPR